MARTFQDLPNVVLNIEQAGSFTRTLYSGLME